MKFLTKEVGRRLRRPAAISIFAGLVAAGTGLATSTFVMAQTSHDLSVTSVTPPSSPGPTVGLAGNYAIALGGTSGAPGVFVTVVFTPVVTVNLGASTPTTCVIGFASADPSTTVSCPATGLTSVTINAVPSAQGTLNIIAGVIGSDSDPMMSNNSATATTTVMPAGTNATFVSQSVPPSVGAGLAFSATVTMKNTGTTTWTSAGGYRLGSLVTGNPWGSSVPLGGGDSIGPNQSKTFTVSVTAPYAAGAYGFQWQMFQGAQAFGQVSPLVQVAVTPTAMTAYSVTPCRVIDTRGATGTYGGPALGAGTVRVFPMRGQCGVPAAAKALMVVVTIVSPTADGFLVVYPANLPVPGTTTANYSPGLVARSGNSAVTLDVNGQMAVMASSSAQFILDLTGYMQ